MDLLQHTGLKKPAIQKALDALAEQGKITAKASTVPGPCYNHRSDFTGHLGSCTVPVYSLTQAGPIYRVGLGIIPSIHNIQQQHPLD